MESESICDTNRVSSYLVRLSVKGVDVVAGGRRECVLDSLFPVVMKHVFGVGNGDLNRCVSRLAKVETVHCYGGFGEFPRFTLFFISHQILTFHGRKFVSNPQIIPTFH